MGLSNAKCKLHLAYRFFWHSATVPSHMWDSTIALCQKNLVYFNSFKSLSLLLQYSVIALSSPLFVSRHCQASLIPSLSLSLSLSLSRWITKPLSPSSLYLSESQSRCHQALSFKTCHRSCLGRFVWSSSWGVWVMASHAWRLVWRGRFWFWVGSDGVLIGGRRSGGFRWSLDRCGFCGDRSFDRRIWRSGFDCVGFVPMGFW